MDPSSSFAIVVVGASAGGVQALGRLLEGLPIDIEAALFVVLHIPAHTPSELAPVLQRFTRLWSTRPWMANPSGQAACMWQRPTDTFSWSVTGCASRAGRRSAG